MWLLDLLESLGINVHYSLQNAVDLDVGGTQLKEGLKLTDDYEFFLGLYGQHRAPHCYYLDKRTGSLKLTQNLLSSRGHRLLNPGVPTGPTIASGKFSVSMPNGKTRTLDDVTNIQIYEPSLYPFHLIRSAMQSYDDLRK